MSKSNIKTKVPQQKKINLTTGKQLKVKTTNTLARFEEYLAQREKLFFVLTIIFSFIFSLLLFDLKVSRGGDDAAYIIRAHDLIKSFKYPGFQGPMYPFILSIFVAIFGIKLWVLKFLSLIFMVLQFYFLYKAFAKRLPSAISIPAIVLCSFNAYILYYSGQTYSEALFMLIQAATFYYFFKYFLDNQEDMTIKKDYAKFIMLGLLVFLAGITRSIGYVTFIAIILMFAVNSKWKNIAYFTVAFLPIQLIFEVLKKLIWGNKELQFQSQAGTLFLIDPYYPDKGKESLMGYFQRFIDNSNIYLSKYLYNFFGFREDITETAPALTVITFILFFIFFIYIVRNNKYLTFTYLYTAIIYATTFIILQKRWDSARLVISIFPYTVLLILGGFYYLTKENNNKYLLPVNIVLLGISAFGAIKLYLFMFKTADEGMINRVIEADGAYLAFIFVLVTVILLGFSLYNLLKDKQNPQISEKVQPVFRAIFLMLVPLLLLYTSYRTIKKVKINVPVITENISGNKFFGFTPDWQNYLKMVEWTKTNIPETEVIACRKPDIAQIYGERKYVGLYRVISEDADTLVASLKEKNVRYIIMANLRKYEQQKTEYTINTIRRIVYFIQQKYPNSIYQIHQEGNDEEAVLLEIKYEFTKPENKQQTIEMGK
jgi:hypothetical protein